MLPAGFANMSPVLTKFWFKGLAKPIDGNRTWRGKPIFGANKTWRGIIMAPLFGIIMFGFQRWLYGFEPIQQISFINYHQYGLGLGFLLGLGAILGDLLKSFFKRRINRQPGKPWIPFDQIDYTTGGIILGALIFWPGWTAFFTTIGIGLLLHFVANLTGYALKLNKSKI